MAKAESLGRDNSAVGISEILRWKSRRGAMLFVATALVLGGLATSAAVAAKVVQYKSDGFWQALAFAGSVLFISFFCLRVLMGGMIACFADSSVRNDAVVREGRRSLGFKQREDYFFIALWLCVLAPAIAGTTILLAKGLGVETASDWNAIGLAVVLSLGVMVHACQRFLANSIKRIESS